jgi:hypothetical protein
LYGWLPMLVGVIAPVVSFWLDRIHPEWDCGGLTVRAGAITTVCGAIAGYRGAKAFVKRVGTRGNWVTTGPFFDLPYGWISLVLVLVGTAVWGYGSLFLPTSALPGCR